VAIDWADQKHVWALQTAGSLNRQHGELEATPEAVDAWVGELLARYAGQPIAVALEQKRGALLYQLSKYERLVLYPVHGASVNNLREALYPSGAKDDVADADLLLELLSHHRAHLRRLEADTVETRKLQSLVEDRRKLVDDQSAYTQQLGAKLKLYFPQALRWMTDLKAPTTAAFLHRWPTLDALQKARPTTIRRFFQQHHSRSEEWLQFRLEEIPKAVAATRDPAIVESSVAMVQSLLQLIQTLHTRIAELDRQIAATAAVHPELRIMQSLPGAGPALEPRLLAALGTDRNRFKTASELQIVSGIAPVKQASGKSEWVHFRWACSKFLRQTFHEWAAHTIGFSRWANAYYDYLTQQKHKDHHAAVRALAFKWQRILFRCWKDGQPYDEEKYIAALRRRGSHLATMLGS
jgi:transposase